MINALNIERVSAGRQDCSDLHSWGPGVRTIYVVHYIIKGRGYVKCGNNYYSVSAGQSFVIYPYVNIYYYPDPNDPWEYVWINFENTDCSEIFNSIKYEKNNCIIGKIDAKEILPYFDKLVALFEYGKNERTCMGLAHVILGIFADKFPLENGASAAKSRMLTALAIIQSNYHKPNFNINELSSAMNISRVTLHRLFQKETRMSPNNFLIQYRINNAKEMLKINVPIKAVALSCGFSDTYYFSRCFKQWEGISPKNYRENLL